MSKKTRGSRRSASWRSTCRREREEGWQGRAGRGAVPRRPRIRPSRQWRLLARCFPFHFPPVLLLRYYMLAFISSAATQ